MSKSYEGDPRKVNDKSLKKLLDVVHEIAPQVLVPAYSGGVELRFDVCKGGIMDGVQVTRKEKR